MNSVNDSLAKLLEYEHRATGTGTAIGGDPGQRDWAGLAFRVGDMALVCSLDRIDESLPLPQVTRVPGTKPFILGLANVRGDLITVVDLGCFLTEERSNPSISSRLLSASLRGRPVGLLVDEVIGQRNFVRGEADQPVLPEDSPLSGLALKQHRSGSGQLFELDLDSLFGHAGFLDGAAA